MGLEYEKIHACPNDYILYRNEYVDLDTCPRCRKSRYKRRYSDSKKKGVPAKVLWYLPIIPRILKENSSKNFVLLPYCEGHGERGHWILFVINMINYEVYIFDALPRHLEKIKDLKISPFLDRAILVTKGTQPKRVRYSKVNVMKAIAKCAKQPGSVECGYYVMRYMYDIILNYSHSNNLLKDYERTDAFSVEELEEVVEIFTNHVVYFC